MKFFKHFTDAHEGRSMQALMNKFGLEGYAAFFILTEICASKLEKETDEEFAEDHFKFTFNERIVREKLRMRSTKVELFLNYCSTLDLLKFTKVEDEFNFYFPKILESLDRDAKRARHSRAKAAPKIKIKNKEEDKEKDKEKDSKEVTEEKVLPEDPFFKKQHNRHELNEAAKIWNENCGDLVKIRMLTKNWAQRSDALIAEYGADNFRKGVVSVASNKFLTGNSRSKWKATFTWIIKDDNLAKVLVGDYASENGVESMINELSRELGLS